MSIQEDRRNKFALTFNKLLGHTGKSAINPSDAQYKALFPDLESTIKAARLREQGTKSSTGSSTLKSSSGSNPDMTPEQKASYLSARDKEMKNEDRPWYKDVLHGGLNVLTKLDIPAAYIRSGVKELSDTVETSRVGHWLYDAMDYNPAEDERTPSSGSWSDFVSQGKRHMGFGEIWSDARGNDKNKWLDRAVGLTGDVVLDPLTHYKGGSKVVAADKTIEGTGKAAVQGVGKKTANAVADITHGADNIFEKAAAEKAALYKYAKAHPNRVTSKYYRQGLLSADEAISRIKAAHPTDLIVTGATGRNTIEQATEEVINRSFYEIQKQTQKGKLLGNPKELGRFVANHVTEAAKRVRLKPLEDATITYRKALSTGKALTVKELDGLKSTVPYFKEWHEAVLDSIAKSKKLGGPTTGQVDNAFRDAFKAVDGAMQSEIDDIFAVARESTENSLKRIPVVTWFGKEIAELPALGEFSSAARTKFLDTGLGEATQKLFSYTSNFPGYSSNIAQKARALGVVNYELKRNEIIKIAHNYSRSEAKELQRMLENGITGTGKMADGVKFLREAYDNMASEEVAKGVRNLSKNVNADNYAYTHIYKRRKPGKSIKAWNDARTETVQKTGKLIGYTSQDAINAGFSVERDAFKNLLMRNMRSNRKITDAYFYTDLVSHYGIKGRLSDAEAASRGLHLIKKEKNNDILDAMGASLKEGERIFVDNDIQAIYKNYTDLSKFPDEIVRTLDYLTRRFKIMNTIYFPGYHVRNMIGDTFMGALDGVKAKDYTTILGKWSKKNTASINVGGRVMKMQEFLETYEKNLGSGTFLSGELDNGLLKGRGIPGTVRKISEGREDFGRIVHFYRAMTDEYTALLRKRVPKEEAWKEAIESSIARVNKFKFDYSALTKNELKYMRRGIPFYTYMRKAIPTLTESLMLNPKYLANINRAQTGLEDRYGDTLLPDWMRELGYGKLTDTYGMAGTILPTQTVKEMFQNPVSNFNPLIQIPFEMNSGKDTFTHRPLQGEGLGALPEILSNKWRGTGTIRDAFGYDIGRGQSVESDKTALEKWANFFGFPIKRVAEQEKEQALTEIQYKLKGAVQDLSNEVESMGYSVYQSNRKDGINLRVKDQTTGEVVFEAETLKELKDWLKEIRNVSK